MSMRDEKRGTSENTKPAHASHVNEDSNKGKKKKEKKERTLADKIIYYVALVVLIVSLIILAIYCYRVYEAKQNSKALKELYQSAQSKELLVITPEGDTSVETVTTEESTVTSVNEEGEVVVEKVYSYDILPAAQELLDINSDTVGVIEIPDCIFEAVVQTTDNDYYLTHNFYDQKRSAGACFADYRNVIYGENRSDNIILYAHNNKDGSMFGNMDYYLYNVSYWLQNPFIYFNTKYSEDIYVIIASFVTNSEPVHDNGNLFDYYNYINFNSEYTYEYWISEVTKRSQIITGVDVCEDDEFLTLSTCAYNWDEARHVIIARKLRDGESTADIDTSLFKQNTNPKWPAIYYKYNGGSYIEDDEE